MPVRHGAKTVMRGASALLMWGGLAAGLAVTVLSVYEALAEKPEPAPVQAGVTLYFSERDRNLIHDYFQLHQASGLPSGLAKRQKLPPGLQKQLREKGQLPPGLHKTLLPGELERRLSQLPPGYERIIVGSDVVLIQTTTRIVLDILKDIQEVLS